MNEQETRTTKRAMPLIMAVGGAQGAHMGAVNLLIPLYVLSLGHSIALVGALIAALAVFQVLLQFFGGVASDRFGERTVLAYSFSTSVASTLVFALTDIVWLFVASQLVLGATRAVFYPASQSYASRIDENDRARVIGRFRGGSNLGSTVGPIFGGILGGTGSFTLAFAGVTAISITGLLASALLPDLPRRQPKSLRGALTPTPRLMRSRPLGFVGLHSIVLWSALGTIYMAVTVAFFADSGISTEVNGLLGTVAFMAAAGTGFLFGRLVSEWGTMPVIVSAFCLVGTANIVMAFGAPSLWLLVPAMGGAGASMSLLTSLRITLTAEYSAPEERGIANGVVGLYAGLGQLVMPFVYGVISSTAGMQTAVVVAGGIPLLFAASAPALHRWAMSECEQSAEPATR